MHHIPVLEKAVVQEFQYLSQLPSWRFFDGTLGAAGHSIAIAKSLGLPKPDRVIIGVDQDKEALSIAKEHIKSAGMTNNFILVHDNFKNFEEILDRLKIGSIDGALLDLGVSSMQFDNESRGFSFKDPEQRLDMRMNSENRMDAAYILNNYSEVKIAEILWHHSEERFARKIAKNIIERRKEKKIEKVKDLLEILRQSIPKKDQFGRVHFATKTFQALRIEVNHELEILADAINNIANGLNSGGVFAVITFHSLEDRIVKQCFNRLQNPCECPPALPCVCGKKTIGKVLYKKPIVAKESEVSENPRSRSAKLRVFQKV